MSRKKKELPILEGVVIERVAAEGKSVAHRDGKVVFVPRAVPGDVVDVRVVRQKHHYAEAEVVRLVEASPLRVEPFCPHFGVCGGCQWQCLRYEEQLAAKQQQVVDAFTRLGGLELPRVSPILGSPLTTRYRNKLEFGFSNRRWLTREEIADNTLIERDGALGFHITGAWDKILDITECHLMDEVGDRVRNFTRSWAREHGLSFFDLRAREGLLRNLMIRTSDDDGAMLVFQFHYTTADEEKAAHRLMQAVADAFSEVSTICYVNNLKANDTLADLDVLTFKGKGYVLERMGALSFKVGPKSFYQTNNRQARRLYDVAKDFAALSGKELVYDLYTGTGTIACYVASGVQRVVGIEYVEEAIADARENAAYNDLHNTAFFVGDMRQLLTPDFINQHGRPDVVITDPPRAGMHPDVVSTLVATAPQRIVYVSCNPATQARDVALLTEQGYRLTRVQPVDMFPHTHHVENVVLLER